ncbi:hypothetical protein Tco_1530330 [Tanacetum coccineum]
MNRYGYSSVGRFDVFFCDQLLVFQQHQDESLYYSWTRFKDVIRKVPNHGLSIWTLIEIYLKHIDSLSWHIINLTAEGDLRKFSDIGACSRKVTSFHGPEPQPLLNSPSLDVSLGDVIGPEPPIKPHSPDSSRMKVVDYLTTQTPPSPHVANSHPKGVYSYYNPGINDPKRHYGFKPGLLGKSVSLGVDISNWEMFDDDWGLESKEVSPLGEELSLFDRPNEVERGRILEAHRLEPILQQQISQRMAPSHHDGNFSSKTKNLFSQNIETASRFTRDAVTMTPVIGLYLTRRSLEVLRKFHWMIIGGRFNPLSHVSSPLLSKPGEY